MTRSHAQYYRRPDYRQTLIPILYAHTFIRETAMTTTVRRALVTGATSGIGQAIAEALASQGVHVLVTGRDARRGEEVVARIRAARGKADFVVADLASAQSVANLAIQAERSSAASTSRVTMRASSPSVRPLK
jgi:NAD(P)-dependent dehydrogenase (short-subunit alcohol dehydrogenase family)